MISIRVNEVISSKHRYPDEAAEKFHSLIEKGISQFGEKFPNEEITSQVSVGVGVPNLPGDFLEVSVESEDPRVNAEKIKSEIAFILSELYPEDGEILDDDE
jgi:hypothetical protein